MKIEHLYGRRYDPVTEIAITTGATEGAVRGADGAGAAGRRSAALPAGVRLLPARRAVERRAAAVRDAALSGLPHRLGRGAARGDARTRVIVLNTPHNPTGMMWSHDDVRELAGVLGRTDAVVISDEVYEHVRFDGARHESLARHPDIADRALVISSFGKTYHTTGWKVGYCAGPAALVAEVLRVRQWMTFSVNGAVQMAYADAVRRNPGCDDVTAFYEGRKATFLKLVAGSRFRPLACRGTYFQLMDYSAITERRRRGLRHAAHQGARRGRDSDLPLPPARRARGARAQVLLRQAGRNARARGRALASSVGVRAAGVLAGVVVAAATAPARARPPPLPDPEPFYAAARANMERAQIEQRDFAYRERRTELHLNPFGRLGTGGTRALRVHAASRWRRRTAAARARRQAGAGCPGGAASAAQGARVAANGRRGRRRRAAVHDPAARETVGGQSTDRREIRAQAGSLGRDPRGQPGAPLCRDDLRGRGLERGGARASAPRSTI